MHLTLVAPTTIVWGEGGEFQPDFVGQVGIKQVLPYGYVKNDTPDDDWTVYVERSNGEVIFHAEGVLDVELFEGIPQCILLVDNKWVRHIKSVANMAGCTVRTVLYDGELRTDGHPS